MRTTHARRSEAWHGNAAKYDMRIAASGVKSTTFDANESSFRSQTWLECATAIRAGRGVPTTARTHTHRSETLKWRHEKDPPHLHHRAGSLLAGDFGHEYLKRNTGEELITANTVLFSQVLRCAPGVKSITELGCNIGLNLQALHRINHQFKLGGYEINERAAGIASERNIADIVNGTILDDDLSAAPGGGMKADLTFTKGVLIHINRTS